MGLEGTLRAFSVMDILQVLGLHRKTGILKIEGKEDTITVSFIGGQIVSADSAVSSLDERVGNLLVRTGKLSSEKLTVALETQRTAPLRLAEILLRHRLALTEDLQEALRLQINRIILTSFRWTEGKFRFEEEAATDHDEALLHPIPADSLLMEAAHTFDEQPRLEKRIPSLDLVFRRAGGVENLRLVVTSAETGDGALLVSAREAETWRWVDGKCRVGEILERAFLSDLDVYRGLADLLDRNLVVAERLERAAGRVPAGRARRLSARTIGSWRIVLLLAASAVREFPRNPLNLLLGPRGETRETANFLASVSLARLASIERAVRIYYDSSGHYPRSLEDLLAAKVIDVHLATDPYGRAYRYILRSESGKFSLYGRDSAGGIDLDLSFERSVAPVSGPAPRGTKPPEQPGVQVVQ
jgi:Domain of unknown function (DUF4388)